MGIRARQLRITTIDEWRKLAQTCLTVHYHGQKEKGANWFESGAKSYTLQQWSSIQPLKKNQEFTDNTIISVYDRLKKKRILVDGNDRATILTSEDQSQTKPNIDILLYEGYGEHVNMIFPCEFCQFYGSNHDMEKASAKTRAT